MIVSHRWRFFTKNYCLP
jgi:hypothetical protein